MLNYKYIKNRYYFLNNINFKKNFFFKKKINIVKKNNILDSVFFKNKNEHLIFPFKKNFIFFKKLFIYPSIFYIFLTKKKYFFLKYKKSNIFFHKKKILECYCFNNEFSFKQKNIFLIYFPEIRLFLQNYFLFERFILLKSKNINKLERIYKIIFFKKGFFPKNIIKNNNKKKFKLTNYFNNFNGYFSLIKYLNLNKIYNNFYKTNYFISFNKIKYYSNQRLVKQSVCILNYKLNSNYSVNNSTTVLKNYMYKKKKTNVHLFLKKIFFNLKRHNYHGFSIDHTNFLFKFIYKTQFKLFM